MRGHMNVKKMYPVVLLPGNKLIPKASTLRRHYSKW